MKPLRRLLAAAGVLAAGALGACIPYPADQLPDDGRGNSQYGLIEGAYPGLDAGASELSGLHFKVHTYGSSVAQETSDMCEAAYSRIMTDTGLYSFQPRGMYSIVVYGSQDEYRKKTGQPDWSAGVTVGNAIYTFYSPVLNGILSHEMTHLIWFEYMNGRLSDQQRWVNEGLAVYEEAKARNHGYELFGGLVPTLRTAPIPIDQLQNMAPNTERAYDASLWYAESESLIRFMIERGGRIGFGQFLASIQQGQTFDAAIAAAYPAQWQSLGAFYNSWKGSLQ
ncbi:MAG: peptidase MA family metallohydrolase [Elusimicrobiota bacterium]